MLVCFFLQKLLIFFIHNFKEKLILPVEKFSLKREMIRNLQATGKHLLECEQLVQIYCRHPVHPAFSSRTHQALCFRKSKIVYVFWQIPDEMKLQTTPISHVDHWCLLHPSFGYKHQPNPGKKSAWGWTALKGKLCWMLWTGRAILQRASLLCWATKESMILF